jgi:hypothetical protein
MGVKIPQGHVQACARRLNDSNKSIAWMTRMAHKRKGCGAHLKRSQEVLRAALRFARVHWRRKGCGGATKEARNCFAPRSVLREYIKSPRLFCRRGFFPRSHPSVDGLGLRFLQRVGRTWLVIAIFENEYLYPLASELLGGRPAGHVDIDVVAVHLRPGVFNPIVARVAAGPINSNAGVQRQYSSIGGHGPWLRPFAGSSEALHRVSGSDEVTNGWAPMVAMRVQCPKSGRRQDEGDEGGKQQSQIENPCSLDANFSPGSHIKSISVDSIPRGRYNRSSAGSI